MLHTRAVRTFLTLLSLALVLLMAKPVQEVPEPAETLSLASAASKSKTPAARATKNHLSGVGVQFHGTWSNYNDAQRKTVLRKLKAMGAKWVRIDIGWSMLQPNRGAIQPNSWGVQQIDRSITLANQAGLKVLGTLWLTPDWANNGRGERSGPNDPNDYGKALKWAAEHWDGKVKAWEVWNEPNSGDFFVGANPVEYTKILCAADRAMDSSSSKAKLIYGGTMYSDDDWIRRTYDAGAKGCFDIMAVHPYVAPADKGPAYRNGTMWQFDNIGAVRKLMLARGDRKPIWATEMGWSAHKNFGGEGNWEKGVTKRQQASFSVQALKRLHSKFPYVRKAFFYNERAKPGENLHQRGYGIMSENFKPRKVYWALKRLLT